ncbi:MAG: hypothetical protein GC160_04415 [Acidobacteria bacterium]|nr:hypothetical protein [Acidobacteriota bacterium]
MDLRGGRTPNALTYPAAAAGFLISLLPGGMGPLDSLEGLVGGLLLTYPLFRIGGLGGGDVKLVAAIGCLHGFAFILNAVFYSLCSGIALGVLVLAWRGRFFSSLEASEASMDSHRATVAFAPALSVGVAYSLYLQGALPWAAPLSGG